MSKTTIIRAKGKSTAGIPKLNTCSAPHCRNQTVNDMCYSCTKHAADVKATLEIYKEDPCYGCQSDCDGCFP